MACHVEGASTRCGNSVRGLAYEGRKEAWRLCRRVVTRKDMCRAHMQMFAMGRKEKVSLARA